MIPNESQHIKIMTFNIRNGGNNDGLNGIDNRHPIIQKMIERESPDIIGFQEISSEERRWIRSMLGTDYALVGGGRDENYRGEGCSVAFKTDIMELVNMETRWLSDTPDMAGSRFRGVGQSAFPRLLHSLTLKHKNASKPITIINTHLDHVGADARIKELSQIYDYIRQHKECGALMGDFNILPNAPECISFREKAAELGWRDVTADIGGSYHEFGKCLFKIDYIYTDLECREAYPITDVVDGVYCSDHYPLCAVIKLP